MVLTGWKLDAMVGAPIAALGWIATEWPGSGVRCNFGRMKGPRRLKRVVGRAQVLVSGDRDLLAAAAEIEKAFDCPIVTLNEFGRSRLGA